MKKYSGFIIEFLGRAGFAHPHHAGSSLTVGLSPLALFCPISWEQKRSSNNGSIPHAAVSKAVQIFTFIVVLLSTQFAAAQNTTIGTKEKSTTTTAHKVMLIPFEPKLYNSEIDYMINKETKLSAKEIKFKFRDGMNEQLYKAFKNSKYGVVDLMEDTVKFKKDIEAIYSHLNYEYMKVPDQEHYKPPVKEKAEKHLDKGQVKVETNSDARFMNAKIDNAKLVPTLYGKFKTDIFIFINQLDIKAAMSSTEYAGGGGEYRKLVVHYTVYTYDAKEINSGIAEQEFPATLNDPSKIISKYMAKLAETINTRVVKALAPAK